MYGVERCEFYVIVFMLIVLVASLGYLYLDFKHAPPEPQGPVLVDYWSVNDTCAMLVDDRPADMLAFVADEGIVVARFNATVEGLGYLYVAPGPCPEWLSHATIYIVEPKQRWW